MRRAEDSLSVAKMVEAAVVEDMNRLIRYYTGHVKEHRLDMIGESLSRRIVANKASRTWYSQTGQSRLLQRLAAIFGQTPKPDEIFEKSGQLPTPVPGLDLETGDFRIPLSNGYTIVSGWIDAADPDALPMGDYFAVEDPFGRQVYYGESCDLDHAQRAKSELNRFFLACLGDHDSLDKRDSQAADGSV